MPRTATLALNEWAVLAVVVEKPRHGYDIAAALDRDSEIGRAWRLGRPLVYRALDRLEEAGYIERRRTEPGDAAPPRTVYGATRKGRAALKRWLHEPVQRLRDVRSALLLKLVLIDRLGLDRAPLVEAQQGSLRRRVRRLRRPRRRRSRRPAAPPPRPGDQRVPRRPLTAIAVEWWGRKGTRTPGLCRVKAAL